MNIKQFTLVGWILLFAGSAKSQDLQWELVPPPPPVPNSSSTTTQQTDRLVWERVVPVSSTDTVNITLEDVDPSNQEPDPTLVWEPVEIDDVIALENEQPITIEDSTQAIKTALRALDEEAPTYASSRALLRNDRWHPQISFLIPNGYGPKGFIFDGVITGTDCTLGKGPCEPFTSFSNWQESIKTQANGSTYFNVGFGDTQSWGGILITTSAETISSALGSGDGPLVDKTNILQGIQTGLHYSKAIGPDTSFRTGVENWITWDSEDFTFSDMTRNFYFVGSQRFRLKKPTDESKWFRNAYLTLGVGNGEFKPIEQTFKDQTLALKNAGCATYGFSPATPCSKESFKRALRTGSDYGQINPIGAVSIEVVDGVHLLGEWSGRNLNAGLSWRPFKEIGFVITPMIESIVRNCEYPGCKVKPISNFPEQVPLPEVVLTSRARLSLSASFQVQF